MVTEAMHDTAITRPAFLEKFGYGRVVQLKQNHESRMFCPSQIIELAMVTLAVVQKELTILKHLTFELMIVINCGSDFACGTYAIRRQKRRFPFV
mmetsp:Transcript_69227/g.104376  ORF Transcript_69227/g.104376 Transcript_69227/m.104376 type:complete len:95 (-) Transcript_69227:1515-1799(-)